MNVVDIIIVVFAVGLAGIGYERGLIASALPLAGFVVGALIGGRLGPALLEGGGESPYAPLVTVLAGLLLGVTIAVVMEGIAAALRVRLIGRGAVLAQLDGAGGAVLLAGLALVLAWALGAATLSTSGSGAPKVRATIRRGVIPRSASRTRRPGASGSRRAPPPAPRERAPGRARRTAPRRWSAYRGRRGC